MKRHWLLTRHSKVELYVPNLIGYVRVACALCAFAVALHRPLECVFWYFLGFVLDAVDGYFARLLQQTSTLGTVLDMVTDRLATAGLLATLGVLNPRWHFGFLALLMLDVFSHWFQMYATLVSGAATHKDVGSRSALVRCYYRRRLFMGFCCVCCEVLYLALYLLHWPAFRAWRPLPLHLPAFAAALFQSGGEGGRLPFIGLVGESLALGSTLPSLLLARHAAGERAPLLQAPAQRAAATDC
ncbi:hypothetical protein WJX81_006390 [Elliptochloris bilobata]|uniref:CDP-diacylglycerol--inositol 3-phosphatidyltransferase n=1 Tax=Elliptochloris bilobata TaxID=381761 RepID=A0AAW1RZV0_9CHLO